MFGWGRQPAAEIAPEAPLEAMATDLNPRGAPYVACGLTFSPGVWVEVTAQQAITLSWCDWVTVRAKEATDV